jgi:hypothetical protein
MFPGRRMVLAAETQPRGTEFLDAWMQRRESKIGLRDRKCHRRPKERNDTGENPRRNGLFPIDDGFRSSARLDGGVRSPVRTGLY